MSEMVERVAEAIWRQEWANAEREPACTWEEFCQHRNDWRAQRRLATAAIEAVREATQNMLSNGAIATNRLIGVSDVYDIYAAMIDTALAEGEAS